MAISYWIRVKEGKLAPLERTSYMSCARHESARVETYGRRGGLVLRGHDTRKEQNSVEHMYLHLLRIRAVFQARE